MWVVISGPACQSGQGWLPITPSNFFPFFTENSKPDLNPVLETTPKIFHHLDNIFDHWHSLILTVEKIITVETLKIFRFLYGIIIV
jgi:hypothetical protein